MEKCAIYARYSSHNQREVSIEQQVAECRRTADRGNFNVIKVYADKALTGKNDNRPQFQKMIADSEKQNWSVLIVYAIDRFARNRYDSAIYKAKLKKNGVRVIYATGSIPDTPEGIILESVMEGYAEFYSENLSRSIKRGLAYNAENGLAVGKPSLGYKIVDHRYVLDEPKANAVREIFRMYDSGMSSTQIINRMNELGITTATGKPFVKGSLHSVLTNVRYKGVYKVGELEIPGGIPAIVSEELFDRVQAKYKETAHRKAHYKAKVDYLLTGKVFCGHCGSMMIGESGVSKHGVTYNYYKCSTRKHHGSCDKKPEKKEWLEDIVVREVSSRILTPDRIHDIAVKAHQIMVEESTGGLKKTLESELKETKSAISNIMKAIEQGIITPTTKERLEELEERKNQLECEIEEQDFKYPVLTADHIEFWLTKFVKGDIENKDHQRRIIDTLVNKVFVYDNPDGGRKITILCNLTDNNQIDISLSDIDGYAPQSSLNPNPFIVQRTLVGFTTEVSL